MHSESGPGPHLEELQNRARQRELAGIHGATTEQPNEEPLTEQQNRERALAGLPPRHPQRIEPSADGWRCNGKTFASLEEAADELRSMEGGH